MLTTVIQDRTFDFILKTPPASFLLKQAAGSHHKRQTFSQLTVGITKGSGTPNQDSVGQVTKDQIKSIAESKLPDLNCITIDSAIRTIEGTAKNMGITITDA